ncbi:MAG: glycosyltransferase 87 family protein, partial [bacterium]
SYPILYALDRGNFDMFLFVIFAGFVYLFKSKKYLLSAVLLGIQNAIKPFPLLFLLLFLFKKKYKEFFLSLLISGLLIIGSFLCFKGGFFHQITTYIQSLVIFKKLWIYNISGNGMSESSSLFGALKFLLCVYNHVTTTLVLEKLYIFIASIITMITIIFTYKEDVFWKKITLLTLNMLLVPYIIIDYKLIFLFIPIWLFVNAKEKTKLDLTYTILLGLLLIPKKIFFLWLHVEHMTQLVTYGIIINPILMLIFMGLIIYEQLSKKQKKEENEN